MDDKPFESLNMIPFIDIMLVLLTIVLTTSSFIASGHIPVNLPQATANAPELENIKTQTIEIDAKGGIFYDGEPVSAEALKTRLAPLDKETPMLLRADKDVTLQRFVDVADVLKALGFSKVAVMTETAET